MKSKLLLHVAVLILLCNSALAQEIYPREGAAEEQPYLLKVHGCNLQGISVGSQSVPIARNSSYTVLVLSPSRYWKLKSVVLQEIVREKESSTELKKAKKKVVEFESAGNIQAMEHWARKAASIELEIIRRTNRRRLPKLAQEIVASERPASYHGLTGQDRYRVNTLQELIDITGDNCVEGFK